MARKVEAEQGARQRWARPLTFSCPHSLTLSDPLQPSLLYPQTSLAIRLAVLTSITERDGTINRWMRAHSVPYAVRPIATCWCSWAVHSPTCLPYHRSGCTQRSSLTSTVSPAATFMQLMLTRAHASCCAIMRTVPTRSGATGGSTCCTRSI